MLFGGENNENRVFLRKQEIKAHAALNFSPSTKIITLLLS